MAATCVSEMNKYIKEITIKSEIRPIDCSVSELSLFSLVHSRFRSDDSILVKDKDVLFENYITLENGSLLKLDLTLGKEKDVLFENFLTLRNGRLIKKY